ncbi:GNAT family N-acetyltransferase [Streptomyces sp. NPDC057939]|uniref:GNAT family N-acetyltransferase n=1 Tax=Streptomyces sp. NPDC057939 TaxID=3346284 RepID=UPI0036E35B2C
MSSVREVVLRPYDPGDEAAVLRLSTAEGLPGQPVPDPAMLAEALAGRSPVDGAWWAALEQPQTWVAVDRDRAVTGVVSYALRPEDDTGQLLWLHCREDGPLAERLVRHVLRVFGARRVEAFQFASALSHGLEALPTVHRPSTAAALERAGFTGERLWRYMRAALPAQGLPRLAHVRVGPDPEGRQARRLEVEERGLVCVEAVVGLPLQGTAVLWWIEVATAARGRGLGRAMLGSALDVAADLGATEVILYVDDDAAPGEERDRTAANALYDTSGFVEVDRLFSYARALTV